MDKEQKIAKIRAKVTPVKHIPRGTVETMELLFNIQFLLDELEQTRKERNMLREELHKFQELAIKAANHHKAERDKLIEALRWYADEIKYMNWPSELWINQGQRARDILKEVGVTVE